MKITNPIFKEIKMKEYIKINSIFERDMTQRKAPFILGKYAEPEFEYLKDNDWEWTEKIDGTNIRVMLNGNEVEFGGKTDSAQIPAHLVTRLQNLFLTTPRKKLLHDIFGEEWKEVCLYGEGFGNKIQGKVGIDYLKDDVDFVLFDVKIGSLWLERLNVIDIANKLDLKVVPTMGFGSLDSAIKFVTDGFDSHFGNAKGEGLVLRPVTELLNRRGHRIITKIKHRDFI